MCILNARKPRPWASQAYMVTAAAAPAMRLAILLLCCTPAFAVGSRVVVTFVNASAAPVPHLADLAVVKRYGRRLVLALPPQRTSLLDAELAAIAALGPIVDVEVDSHVLTTSAQWNLYGQYGIHLPTASASNASTNATAIAVLDSGFASGGWDFVSDASISGDGDGRDANATDPGSSQCCYNRPMA